jgi:hypothetical protein
MPGRPLRHYLRDSVASALETLGTHKTVEAVKCTNCIPLNILVMMGETDVSELRTLRAYCSSSGDCDVDHGMMILTGPTPNSSTRVLWQPPVLSGRPVSRDISETSRRMGESHIKWNYSMWDFKFSRRRVWCSELSSGLYCHVKWLSTDVSEVRTASIIRDE